VFEERLELGAQPGIVDCPAPKARRRALAAPREFAPERRQYLGGDEHDALLDRRAVQAPLAVQLQGAREVDHPGIHYGRAAAAIDDSEWGRRQKHLQRLVRV
jgi:hypothetical protein